MGAIEREFDARVALSARELVESSDGVLVLALPANGHVGVMERLAPVIVRRLQRLQSSSDDDEPAVNVHVIISSHASLGAAYFLHLPRSETRKRPQSQRGGQRAARSTPQSRTTDTLKRQWTGSCRELGSRPGGPPQ